MVDLRRKNHHHPELAFAEVETAETIMKELELLRIKYSYGGTGEGVVATIHHKEGAPTIALRAEVDALPGDEHTGPIARVRHTPAALSSGSDMAPVPEEANAPIALPLVPNIAPWHPAPPSAKAHPMATGGLTVEALK